MSRGSHTPQHDAPLSKEESEEQRGAEIVGWDLEFSKVDQGTLFEMILVCRACMHWRPCGDSPTGGQLPRHQLHAEPIVQERGIHDPRWVGFACIFGGGRNSTTGKKAEEIRRMFNIKNDFTPEEEEQVRKENEWCEATP